MAKPPLNMVNQMLYNLLGVGIDIPPNLLVQNLRVCVKIKKLYSGFFLSDFESFGGHFYLKGLNAELMKKEQYYEKVFYRVFD
jgi:hypothetical protein